MAAVLTPQEVAFFNTEGYLLHRQPLLPPAEFAALQAHFETVLQRWTTVTGRPAEEIDKPHWWDPALFRWVLAPAVLDLVEQILGPDLVLFSTHFICKPAGKGKRVPWHEDSAYWKDMITPMDRMLTVWLAIDPSRPDNGCMRLIPRTQHHGFSDYETVKDTAANVFSAEIKKEQVDESKAIDCVLDPNQCSLHHAKLVHGSNANTGQVRRCGFTMRFMTSDVKLINHWAAPDSEFAIYLARGRDRAGNRYGDPTRPNPRFLAQNPAMRPLVAR